MTTQIIKQGTVNVQSHITGQEGTAQFVIIAPETVGLPASITTAPDWWQNEEIFPIDVELDEETRTKLEAVMLELPQVQATIKRCKQVQAHLESIGRSLFHPEEKHEDIDFVHPTFSATREGVYIEWFVPQESWFVQQLSREF